jgi:predicted metal-binding membrane protein
VIALLLAAAGVAWWVSAERMAGMDMGPGSDLGALGWFAGIWVVMMAAMMLPSVAPTVGIYARMTRARDSVAPLLFVFGYLAVWAAAGVAAYGAFRAGRALFGDDLHWDGAGRWLAAATLAFAAIYELTALKDACLSKCRSPLGFLVGSWREGLTGAVSMGARHGAWCVGCCWALMAALFALGVMSVAWMALVAALVALEKILRWERTTYAVALILLVLGVLLIAAPDSVPGLVVPGDGAPADSMSMD